MRGGRARGCRYGGCGLGGSRLRGCGGRPVRAGRLRGGHEASERAAAIAGGVEEGGADDQVGAAELRVVQLGAVVHGEEQPLLALPVGGADRRARGVHGQQRHQVREVRVGPAGLREQPGEAARGVVRQVQELHGAGELLLAEAAVVRGRDEVGLGHLHAEVLPLHGRGQQYLDEVGDADGDGGAQAGAGREEGVGDPAGLLHRERQDRRHELPVQVDAGARRGGGEGLAVLLGAEQRAGCPGGGTGAGCGAGCSP